MSNITKTNSGSSFSNIVPVTQPSDYPYQIVSSNYAIIVDTDSGSHTVLLPPAPLVGITFLVKDGDGSADVNPIEIDGNGNTIDGQLDYTIQQSYGFASFLFNGTEWSIIGQ